VVHRARFVGRVRLLLVAGAEAQARDAGQAGDGDAVGGERPLVHHRLGAERSAVRRHRRLHVGRGGRRHPGGEVLLHGEHLARVGGFGVLEHLHHRLRVAGAAAGFPHLGHGRVDGFAHGEAPVQLDAGGVGHRAGRRRREEHLGHGDRPLAQERIVGQSRVELLNLQGDAGDLVHGVVAALGGRAMAAHALGMDHHLHPAALAAVDAQARRLRDHHRLGPDLLLFDEVLPAQPVAVLLNHGAGEEHREVAREIHLFHDLAGVDHGGQPALLVRGAAAPHAPVGDVGVERVEAPQGAVAGVDGVDVGVEGHQALAAPHLADDGPQAVDADLVEAQRAHLAVDHRDHFLFLRGVGRRADQVAQEPGDLGFEFPRAGMNSGVQIGHVTITS